MNAVPMKVSLYSNIMKINQSIKHGIIIENLNLLTFLYFCFRQLTEQQYIMLIR